MKLSLLAFLISLLTLPVLAQDNDIYENNIFILNEDFRINGLLFDLSKQSIIKEFGNPQKVFRPNYECGFFSESGQGEEYYAIKFEHFQFIGNDREGYQLEKFDFTNDKIKITYKGIVLSGKTTRKDFNKIFDLTINTDWIGLWYKDADCQLIFNFKGGRLSNMEFWSPC